MMIFLSLVCLDFGFCLRVIAIFRPYADSA